MIEITDQLDLASYIYTDPETKENEVILRAYKEGLFEGSGLTLASQISTVILKHFDENWKLIQ